MNNTISMKFVLMLLCSVTIIQHVQAQGLNHALKKELDSIFVNDQKYRIMMQGEINQDSLATVLRVQKGSVIRKLIKLQNETDSANIKRIKRIITVYGYPGRTLVDTPTNEAAFYVIQHSQNIGQYIGLIRKAAQKNELPFKLYALMLDRYLMYQGKEQVYGTQAKGLTIINARTGAQEFKMIIWPIHDPLKVNKRRKAAGLNQTVEENAKRLGISYTVYTLADINNLAGKSDLVPVIN